LRPVGTTLDLRAQPDGGSAIGRQWRMRRRTVQNLVQRHNGAQSGETQEPPREQDRVGMAAEEDEGAAEDGDSENGHSGNEDDGNQEASSGSGLLSQRHVSMMGHPFGGRLSGGIRQWSPGLYRWISEHMGTRKKATLLASLIALQAAAFLVIDNPPNDKAAWARGINLWSVEVAKHTLSFVIALFSSLLLDGCWAVPKIFSWHPLWRFLGVSLLFCSANWFKLCAYKTELTPAAVEMFGTLYMPLAAVASYLLFRRRYGILEWLSMGMMTLAVGTFMLIRRYYVTASYVEGGEDASPDYIRAHFNSRGAVLTLCSVCTSVLGSIFAESIFKEKNRRLKSKWALGHDKYYIMKVHIEASALFFAVIVWCMPNAPTKLFGIYHYGVWFGPWSRAEVIEVSIYTALSWVAGLVTQQMSTVVKAIAQSMANIMAVMIGDPILEDRYHFDLRAVPEFMLALIFVMSAIIFQTGRIIIHRLRGQMDVPSSDDKAQAMTEDVDEAADGPNGLFSTAPELPTPVSAPPRETSPAKAPSRSAVLKNYACIGLYIFVDIGRTLLNSYALTNSAINPTTMSLLGFVCGVILACSLTLFGEGWRGMKAAWQCRKICESMPAACLFAVGQCLTSFAYALHISPALANVLGKIYTPLAAFGGRCILDRYYSWLEYFAIIILTLASLAFGYLQEYKMKTGIVFASSGAMLCAVGSAVFAAFGSLAMEKILQGKKRKRLRQEEDDDNGESTARKGEEPSPEPYRIQKIRLDFGSALFSVALLPLISIISSRPKDSLWVNRPWGDDCEQCMPKLAGVPNWPWSELEHACNGDACTGNCACAPSILVGWNNQLLIAALLVNVAQGWLIGQITKQFSTIHRAIADAFSTLLLYWVGDPGVRYLVHGTPYLTSVKDFALDMVSFIVPLSTVTFMVATSQMKEVMEAVPNDSIADSISSGSESASDTDSAGSSSSM